MIDNKQLEAFYAVVSCGSFELAAKQLSLTPSAISQRVKALEQALSIILIERSKPIELTYKGQQVYKYARSIQAMEYDLLNSIKPSGVKTEFTPIAIAVNADTFATWWRQIHPALIHQLNTLPEVLIEDQEHTLELFNKGQVFGCVSAKPLQKEGQSNQLLGHMTYTCVAHHAFVHKHLPNGLTITKLKNLPAILCNRKDKRHAEMIFRLFNIRDFEFPIIYMPSPNAFLDAIMQECGYGMMPLLQIEEQIQEGLLIDLTPQNHYKMPLYWCHWDNQAHLYTRVTQYILNHASQLLK